MEAASIVLREGNAVLFLILTIALTALASVVSLKAWRRRFESDLKAAVLYFASFFLLAFAAPLVWILLRSSPTPASLGLQIGQWRLGLILAAIGVPFAAGVHFMGRKAMGSFYPFSKKAVTRLDTFILYEAAYLLLYYVSWEFTFRGVILFSLLSLLPQTVTGALIAILIQTAISTVFHIGHPDSEIWASLVAGVVFGLIAMATGSILYTVMIHATIGMFEDGMAYRRGVTAAAS